jgi:hypothetical protein
MSSRVQSFDTLLYRLIGGAPPPPSAGALSADYNFGLTDEPPNGQPTDNVFPMPAGNLRFPGYVARGTGFSDALIEFFGDTTTWSYTAPPWYELISMPSIRSIGTRNYRLCENNDPAWDGNFLSLINEWLPEAIAFSADPGQGINHTTNIYAQRLFFADATYAASPPVPGLPQIGRAMHAEIDLFNTQTNSTAQVREMSGFGFEQLILRAVQNGASSQWVTHWNNDTVSPAVGDGPAWWIDVDGRFSRYDLRAGLNPYQRDPNPHLVGWGWRLWGADGTGTLQTILDVTTSGGLLNGKAIPTLDGGATTVESYITGPIDMTVAADTLLVPGIPGMVFQVSRCNVLTTDAAGTLSTPPALTFLSGATTLVAGLAFPGAGQFVEGGSTGFALGTGTAANFYNAGADLILRVTAGATGTGGFALTARLQIAGSWVPLP